MKLDWLLVNDPSDAWGNESVIDQQPISAMFEQLRSLAIKAPESVLRELAGRPASYRHLSHLSLLNEATWGLLERLERPSVTYEMAKEAQRRWRAKP